MTRVYTTAARLILHAAVSNGHSNLSYKKVEYVARSLGPQLEEMRIGRNAQNLMTNFITGAMNKAFEAAAQFTVGQPAQARAIPPRTLERLQNSIAMELWEQICEERGLSTERVPVAIFLSRTEEFPPTWAEAHARNRRLYALIEPYFKTDQPRSG